MKLHKDDTRAILEHLGYPVDRAYKFRMRDDERTASASIDPRNGMITDFGSGWRGDVIEFYKVTRNADNKEAFAQIRAIAAELGIKLELNDKSKFENAKFSNISNDKQNDETQEKKPITQDYINKFVIERKENFARYYELLKKLLPSCNDEKRREIATKFEIGYSKQADRLIMPIKDENGNCATLWKYNPNPSSIVKENGEIFTMPKYTFTKGRRRGTHLFNYESLSEYAKNKNEPIFFAEGEKDCLNMIANGLNAVSLGSASTRLDDKFKKHFKDAYVVIAYDYDKAGHDGAVALAEQLKDTCSQIEILDWQKIAKKGGFLDKIYEKFDFTDYLKLVKNKGRENEHEKETHER